MTAIIQKIVKVEKHPQADKLSNNTLDNGKVCISNLNENGEFRYSEGDLVVHISENSIIPEWLLKKLDMWDEENNKGALGGSEGNIVKACKIRGVKSEGVLMPISSFTICVNNELIPITKKEFTIYENVGDVLDITEHVVSEEEQARSERPTSKEFMEYPSIENFYQAKSLAEFDNVIEHKEIKWCILEKIHGANFQVYFDGTDFKFGKRTSFLAEEESFYAWQSAITQNMKDDIKEIYQHFKKPIRLFGELFGGKYGDAKTKFKCVQREVQYSPNIHVLFYDLMVDGEFLPYGQIMRLWCDVCFEELKFLLPLEIKNRKLSEVINSDAEFLTTIPNTYYDNDLPKLEDNICEGIIIKPYDTEYKDVFGNRLIIKKKNEKFTEKRSEKKPVDMTWLTEVEVLFEKFKPYINDNRMYSALSKESYERKDFGRFLSVVFEDVLKDANKDGINFDNEKDEVVKAVRKMISSEFMKMKSIFFGSFENIGG